MISFLENIVTCSFLTTQYCRKNTTYFLSNLQWSLRQLFCALSPEQTGHPCVLKWKRKIEDLLTFYWITHKFAFSVHKQVISKSLLTFYLRYIQLLWTLLYLNIHSVNQQIITRKQNLKPTCITQCLSFFTYATDSYYIN